MSLKNTLRKSKQSNYQDFFHRSTIVITVDSIINTIFKDVLRGKNHTIKVQNLQVQMLKIRNIILCQ